MLHTVQNKHRQYGERFLNNKNHHICHISTTFIHRAGSTRRTFSILRELADQGYQATLISGVEFDPHPDWDFSGIQVIIIKSLVKYIRVFGDLASVLRLLFVLRKIRPDLVHTHLAKAGIAGRIAARLCNIPLIFHTVHGPTFSRQLPFLKRNLYLFLEKLAGKFTTRFVFVGHDLAREYQEAGVAPEIKCTVIKTGKRDRDFALIRKFQRKDLLHLRELHCRSKKALILAMVARIVPLKQIDHAILALKYLRAENYNAELWIIGEALLPEEKYLKRTLEHFADKHSVEDYIHFLGYRENIYEFMSAADVILLTSKYEGLPNVLVEAGMVSRPAVTYQLSGASEVIRHERTGLIVPPNDIEGLVRAIIILYQDRKLLKNMGRAAGQKIGAEYRMSFMLRQKMKLYSSTFGTNIRKCKSI